MRDRRFSQIAHSGYGAMPAGAILAGVGLNNRRGSELL